MRFDKQFLMKALPNAILKYENFPRYPNVSTDSRTVSQEDIFVALNGKHVDGHDFILDAINNGAAGLIVAIDKISKLEQLDVCLLQDKLVIVVPDVLLAMVKLATAWRDQFAYPVVGITGSVGKSSTKEMVRNILDEYQLPNIVSYGNQNSLIGVSINVLKMRSQHKVAVFELGISNRGEMADLVAIVRPTIAVITAIGHSHMAGLGALSDIAEEKRMIFKFFKEDNIGIINGDQALLSQIGYIHPVIKFGSKTTNQIQARKIRTVGAKTQFTLKIYHHKFVDVKICGGHEGSVYNALGATAVACLLNIPYQTIVRGIEKPVTLRGRFELKSISYGKGGNLIDDCYNASPESVKAALIGFDKIASDHKKIVVLSDMNELGVDAPFWHRQIGRLLCKMSSLDGLVLIGKHIKEVQKTLPVGFKAVVLEDWEAGVIYLQTLLAQEKLLVLVKGSTRGYTEGLAKLVTKLAVPVKKLKPAKLIDSNNKQNIISSDLSQI
jgi:UDP-N-acetylmuramoyl-tripeptide--D-alanyl-D-alanine ligase